MTNQATVSRADLDVQCTRCRNCHKESERVKKPSKDEFGTLAFNTLVCPRCGGKSYYDMTPSFAWCWASGLIEYGPQVPEEDEGGRGCIVIAQGPTAGIKAVLSVLARQSRTTPQLLVPGVPEADDQKEAGDALATWLAWCAKGNGKRHRWGVTFNAERSA